jgi:hypothetical protein
MILTLSPFLTLKMPAKSNIFDFVAFSDPQNTNGIKICKFVIKKKVKYVNLLMFFGPISVFSHLC